MLRQCDCHAYREPSRAVADALNQLLECVTECERDWSLLDRIDLSLGTARRRPQRAA
jgi:hypothetical protein